MSSPAVGFGSPAEDTKPKRKRSGDAQHPLARNFKEETDDEAEAEGLLYHYSRRTLTPRSEGDVEQGKMLHYDVDRMMSWPALFQITGTVIQKGTLWKTCAVYWVIAATLAAFVYLGHVLHLSLVHDLKVDSDTNLEHLSTVAAYITALLGFMIGFFVSLSLQRWWKLRDDCLGGLHRAVGDICLYLSVRLTQPEDAVLKETCLRLCLLSHRLVFCEAQKRESDADLEKLINVGLLTEEERERLSGRPRKAQLALVWLSGYIHGPVLATGRLTPQHGINRMEALLSQARCSVGKIFEYINTQLPFAYVHLLSIACLLSNLLIACKVGVAIGKNLSPDTPTDLVYVTVQLAQLFFVPFGYHAFVHLCDELSNPFGDEFGHFPGYAYHCQMRDACTAVFEAAADPPPGLRAAEAAGQWK